METGQFEVVGAVENLGAGEMVGVLVDGDPILIANLEGHIYAMSDTCTHQQCSLSDGEVDGDLVVCPCHGGSFNLRTGAVVDLPARTALRTYPVRVRSGQIEVQLR